MSVRDSQEGSGEQRQELSFAELCERARQREAEQQAEEKKGKGLEYMSLRFNVVAKRRELQVNKKVTPAEYFLLEEIELGTIGGRNSKSTVCSEAEFFLEDLAKNMGIRKNKIYVHLKSLHKKGLITRKPTRSKGRDILGLSEKEFGQTLSDHFKHKESTRKRSLWLAVDNSRHSVDNSENIEPHLVPNEDATSPEKGLSKSQIRIDQVPNEDQNASQVIENKGEVPSLDSSRFILDSSRGQNQEKETHVSGSGDSGKRKRTQAEHEAIIREQVALAKAGKL